MAINLPQAQADFRRRFDAGGRGFDGRVTSFVRSLDHNRAVGGASMSQHLYGLAADVVVPSAQRARFIASMRRQGLSVIDEGDHVHVQRFAAGTIQAQGLVGPSRSFPGSGGSVPRAPQRSYRL